jgi:hypothetical protein
LNRKPHFIYSNERSNSKDCAVCSNRKIKVEGGKLSSTATLAQGNQDCTQVNVLRSTTPSGNISKENSSWGKETQ